MDCSGARVQQKYEVRPRAMAALTNLNKEMSRRIAGDPNSSGERDEIQGRVHCIGLVEVFQDIFLEFW